MVVYIFYFRIISIAIAVLEIMCAIMFRNAAKCEYNEKNGE